MTRLQQQLRDNLVALTSLAIALAALGYNTWRNERTERNRNIRVAGIELLQEIGSLQQIIFYAHYAEDDQRGDPRMGWADVLTINDLATGVYVFFCAVPGHGEAVMEVDLTVQ